MSDDELRQRLERLEFKVDAIAERQGFPVGSLDAMFRELKPVGSKGCPIHQTPRSGCINCERVNANDRTDA